MKKLFVLISLLAFVAFAVNAQTTIATFRSGAANSFSYTGTAADTVGIGGAAIEKIIDLRGAKGMVRYEMSVVLDRESGNVAGHTLTLTGSADGTTYNSIESETLSDAASVTYTWDNVVTDSATWETHYHGVLWNYLKITYDSDLVGVGSVNKIVGKLVEE